ncbi:MAG: hypothetical protein ACYCV0_07360 [Desulfitobacteriaceae bacterium]
MIFYNPSGAPELACNNCGCRWYDRLTNTCYECGTEVNEEDIAEYQAELEKFYAERGIRP